MRAAQDLVEVAALHRAPLARRRRDRRRGRDDELVRPHRDQMVLGLPVAERPEDLVRDQDRPRRRLGHPFGVEGHEPGLLLPVLHREPGREACRFRPAHRPRARDGAGPDQRTADRFVDRHRTRADPVGEPARVRQLVDRVQVLRAHVRRRVARPREQVERQVEEQIDVPRLHLRRVLRLRIARQRVVVIEPPGRAPAR